MEREREWELELGQELECEWELERELERELDLERELEPGLEHNMSQIERLTALLSDLKPHSTYEIADKVYGNAHLGCARIGARIYDLKKKLPSGWEIKGRRDAENPSLYWYQMSAPRELKLFTEAV